MSSSLAWHDEIPGNFCTLEDGVWPCPFENLNAAEAWSRLASASDTHSLVYGTGTGTEGGGRWRVDALNFQPFSGTPSQDRYAVHELEVGGRTWILSAVFDGHLGDATVQHAAHHVPIIVREFLQDLDRKHTGRVVPPPLIADVFSSAIRSFDEAIANDILELFPGGLEAVKSMSDEDIQAILDDEVRGPKNFEKARLCMYGTTALVALVDPDHENLWLANLGDCQAVIVSETSHQVWSYEILTRVHNAENDQEVERVRREHPGETECVLDGRVLGAIAPFRCIGDTPFKQPPEFTRRILYNISPGNVNTSPWEEFLVRNISPPYISSTPEVTHYSLDPSQDSIQKYLILYSDGFTDICVNRQHSVVQRWSRTLRRDDDSELGSSNNKALQLLWHGLGGQPLSVSRALTLKLDVPWMDDIAIVVQSL